jgi:apolipoprotein N-acyltransferase
MLYIYQMNLLEKKQNPLLALASGLLLFAAWPVSPLTLLIFVAWLPLLWMETKVQSRKKFFSLTYCCMFIWNVSTTWWIWNASAPGAVAAFIANSFIMCLPWLGYKIVKKHKGEIWGYISLIAFWMCFEYIHLQDWGLSWPWLTLGNVFATHPQWVQWYEYTGTSAGTLWILVVNILLFRYMQQRMVNAENHSYRKLVTPVLALFIPVILSWLVNPFRIPGKSGRAATNIVVVQPNIDPYEKVSGNAGSFESQLQTLIRTSEKEIDENTALLVWPETALFMNNGIIESQLKPGENFFFNPLWSFLAKHPNMKLFTGVESVGQLNAPTKYSQEFNGLHYESYNGSAVLDSSGAISFYHKTMLVPGVETLPWFLKFLSKWFDKFGGTTAGYAKQKERTVLNAGDYKIAPAICYESIYGAFISKYVKNGANLICIITNDGWWKNTPGHKQHMYYARLRAIENRTWVARSANTGISCFVDPYGTVVNPRYYNTNAAIKLSIPAIQNHRKTFFVRYGDWLSKLMVVFSIGFVSWIVLLKVLNKYFQRKFPALQKNLDKKPEN